MRSKRRFINKKTNVIIQRQEKSKAQNWIPAAEEREGEEGRTKIPMEGSAKEHSRGALQGRPRTKDLG